jgi:hypothetical protein
MNKKITQLGSIIIGLVYCTAISFAYTPPTAAPTANNTDGPLTTGNATETKNGDIKLNGAFYAKDVSRFMQDVHILGTANGGLNSTNVATMFTVGGSTPINALVTGFLNSNTVQADSLKPVAGNTYQTITKSDGSIVRKVCADNDGKLKLCTTTIPPAPTKPILTNVTFALNTYGTQATCTATMNVSGLGISSIPPGSLNNTYFKIKLRGEDVIQDCAQIDPHYTHGCIPTTTPVAFECTIDITGNDFDFQPTPPEAYAINTATTPLSGSAGIPQQGLQNNYCVVNPLLFSGSQYNYTVDTNTIDFCN